MLEIILSEPLDILDSVETREASVKKSTGLCKLMTKILGIGK